MDGALIIYNKLNFLKICMASSNDLLDPRVNCGILCFKHCTAKIFCMVVPKNCPECNQKLFVENGIIKSLNKSETLVFRLPYPFKNALECPCAVVLRPTTGNFLNNLSDLHIALTTSDGSIVEFDQNGLQRIEGKAEWKQCVMLIKLPESWHRYWDEKLKEIYDHPELWDCSLYNDNYNCYTFVLAFLRNLSYRDIGKDTCNKTVFCEKYILPKTIAVGKYISLYRQLLSKHVIVRKEDGLNI